MAYSRINYVGNGSTTQFSINFPLGFLSRADVTCHVIGEVDGLGNQLYRTLTWINDGLVSISGTAPATDTTVVFERTVDKATLVHDYSDGASIVEDNLDQSNKQNIMLVHEVLDGRLGVLQNDIDFGQYTAKNLADPVDDKDAVNLQYFEANNANSNKLAAQAAQAAAEQAEVNAELAEANAEAAAADAAAGVVAALAGYVADAQAAKTAAELAEANAETAEVNAEAAQAAAIAAQSAAEAAVASIGDPLQASQNLADVTSTATARTNLDVYSKAEADAAVTANLPAGLIDRLAFLEKNLAITVLRDQIDSGWSVLKMVDGVADEFEDVAGISDLGGATYDAAGDYLHNPGGYGLDVTTGGTASASSIGGSGNPASVVIDDSTAAEWNADVSTASWWQVQLTSASAVCKLRMNTWSNGSQQRLQDWVLKGSNNGSSFTTVASGTAGLLPSSGWLPDITFANSTTYTYYRIEINTVYGGANPGLYEVEMLPLSTPVAVAVVSTTAPNAPATQPVEMRLVLLHQPVDDVTLNTDVTIETSRDAGTTWTAGTLTDDGFFDASTKILTATIDLSTQPTGTSMEWRYKTFNNKEQRLHGVWMQWR